MFKLSFNLQDGKLKDKINRIIAEGKNLKVPLERAGLLLMRETDKRFRAEQDPNGNPWVAHSLPPIRREGKKKTVKGQPARHKILQDKRGLRSSVTMTGAEGNIWEWKDNGNSLIIGSNLRYARIHQFGGVIKPKNFKFLHFFDGGGNQWFVKQVTIPARPYLGINDKDAKKIALVFEQWHKEVLGS